MSYDLAVYAAEALSPSDLRALTNGMPGLSVDEDDLSVMVRRGARGRYCFMVDGPDRVEPEDVPPEVTAAALGVSHLYAVLVEGSSDADVPYAVRFARKLAQRVGGAVVDQQTDEVWSRSTTRSVVRPPRGDRVSLVQVSWYCLRARLRPDAARFFLDTAQRLLPEAMPRRFGTYEPLQGRYSEAGADGFIEEWNRATTMVFFAGSGVCVGGSLNAGPSETVASPFWSMGLDLHAEPLNDPRWCQALRRLFVAVTDGLPAFYATAEVTRGHIWSGRSVAGDGKTEWSVSPLRVREGWLGLSPTPTWLTWFGSPYQEIVADHLDPQRTSKTAAGILHEWGDLPVYPGAVDGLAKDWLPPDLLATSHGNPRRPTARLIRAKRIPREIPQL